MNAREALDPGRVVAAFDFDGTLTRSDTLLPYLRRVAGTRRLTQGLASAAWAGRRRTEESRAAAKQALLQSTLEGIPNVELAATGRAYADEILASELRPSLLARLNEHRSAGHRIVIVSASLGYYLAPIASELGAESICCRLGTYACGRCNGQLTDPNVRGEAKAQRLRSLLGPDLPTIYAYGNDPVGDAALLELADHPFLMRDGGFVPVEPVLDDRQRDWSPQ